MRPLSAVRIVLLALFFLFGAFLVGQRLTGFVLMSQSCCVPGPTCESPCAALQEPAPPQSGIGVALLILATSLLIAELLFHKQEKRREPVTRVI